MTTRLGTVSVGAPRAELTRSPAAARVLELADRSDVFLAHFEHRRELPLPDAWLPTGRSDLGAPPGWQGAVLPESKYHSFRHERRIGSFHPGHRSKWTAHELCHAVVGFAWRPDAPVLFHALAARLAEALPVALWYFLDEDGLARCPDHRGGGPLFDAYCAACEAMHSQGPDRATRDATWAERGQAFLDREIAATLRSQRLGRVVPSRYATLDLGSDGLAYAAAHAERLRSTAFAEYIERFFPEGTGCYPSLEALAERVQAVAGFLLGTSDARHLSGGRERWIAQDLGWRLVQVREDTDGDASQALKDLVDALAGESTEPGIEATIDAYAALESDFELPASADMFAVGYPLRDGLGRSQSQLEAGIRSGLPATAFLAGDRLPALVAAFTTDDAPVRVGIGHRFARWLETHAPDLEPLARYEAALAHAPAPDLEAITLAPDAVPGPMRLSCAARIVVAPWDVIGYAQAVDAGRTPRVRNRAVAAVVARAADGDVLVFPVSTGDLVRLQAPLDDVADLGELIAAGVLRPTTPE